MPRDRVELVREAWEAWGNGDMERLFAFYADDVVWDLTHFREWPDVVYEGHEGVRRFLSEWLDVWDEYEVGVDQLIPASDDRVVALAWQRGRGRHSGLAMEIQWAQVTTVRDGMISLIENYDDRSRALEAVGLSDHAALSDSEAAENSKANLEVVREVIDAIERQDLSRLLELTDPQVEWHAFFAQLGEGGVYRGHDGMRRYVHDIVDAWEFLRTHVDDTLAVGDVVVLVGRLQYRGKGSGVETESRAGWVIRFDEGRVAYMRAFLEPEQALLDLGRSRHDAGGG